MKVKAIHLFIYLLLGATFQLFAHKQDSLKSRTILAQIGISQNTIRDEVFSPLLYSGSGFLLGINYQTEKRKRINRFAMNGNIANINNVFSNTARQSSFLFSYAYFHQFRSKNAWRWGIISKTHLAYRKFDAAINIGGEGQNADIFSTLNPALQYQSDTHKWGRFSVELDIPIIGVAMARKMYNANSNPDIIWQSSSESNADLLFKTTELIGFSTLKQIEMAVTYQYSINPKTTFSAVYSSNAYQYKRLNNNTNAVNSALKLGLCFLLKK